MIRRDKKHLLDRLPSGTRIDLQSSWPIVLTNDEGELSDSARHAWLKKTLNEFVNVLRPRLRKWYEETRD
jgi:hypothetical protein